MKSPNLLFSNHVHDLYEGNSFNSLINTKLMPILTGTPAFLQFALTFFGLFTLEFENIYTKHYFKITIYAELQ